MNTQYYNVGKYKTFIRAIENNKTFEKKGTTITIKAPRKGIRDCSIRGTGGNLTVETINETINFGNRNKINFFIPLENAAMGTGYLTGQVKKQTFSYKFNVVEVLNNSVEEAKFLVNGVYRIGLGNEIKEEGVIILIKSGKINLESKNIELENMKVTFRKGC